MSVRYNKVLLLHIMISFARNAVSLDKPTWLDVNNALQDQEVVLLSMPETQGEDCHNEDLIPCEAYLLGSPIETAVNLYMDVQMEYKNEIVHYPSRQVGSSVEFSRNFYEAILG